MGHYVHLHVCFACDTNEGVAALARAYMPRLEGQNRRGSQYALGLLHSLAQRTGANPGPKGGLSMWGIIANGQGVAGEFVEVLRPFWAELLSLDEQGISGGPLPFEHVLVFYEEEGTEAANAYEIFWDDDESPTRQLVIKHHERLPFGWHQF